MSVELRLAASIHSSGDGAVVLYLLDTGVNRNNWRVTAEALSEALPGLAGKPLGCVPGYRVNHVHEPQVVGSVTDAWLSGESAYARAEVTDPEAMQLIQSRSWGPVSVVLRASRVTCGRCGADITEGPCEHTASGESPEVVERFRFERVDFVSEPAYPRAGVVRADATTSKSSTDGRGAARGESPKPHTGEEADMDNEQEKQLEQLRAENARLRQTVTGMAAERKREAVDRALEARLRAGLARDRRAEAERLGALEEQALRILAEDAEAALKLTRLAASAPRAPRTPEQGAGEAIEEARLRLFGHRRDA